MSSRRGNSPWPLRLAAPLAVAWVTLVALPAAAAPFDVYYRAGNAANWIFYGGRETRAAADATAAELGRSSGFETKVVALGEGAVRPAIGPATRESIAVGAGTYVRRPGLGYRAGWYRHGGGWGAGVGGVGLGWGGGGFGGGGWGGGWGGGYGGYGGSSSHHHHSSHHHSHEHHSSSHHHSGTHSTAHPSAASHGASRGGHGSSSHHSHSHSHSHSHHSHSHSHGGHRK